MTWTLAAWLAVAVALWVIATGLVWSLLIAAGRPAPKPSRSAADAVPPHVRDDTAEREAAIHHISNSLIQEFDVVTDDFGVEVLVPTRPGLAPPQDSQHRDLGAGPDNPQEPRDAA